MSELDPLARELRQELGDPPESWQAGQRARVRERLREPVQAASLRRSAPWVVAALAIASVLAWVAFGRQPMASEERWLVAEDLGAPFRLDDGSSIALGPGGRGRLLSDASAVRFDLHQGRASFDVVPARKRTWTVSAGKNEVRVVGTRFSVFYGAGEAFEVEVERGIVAVQVPERKASIELEAGDHLHGHPGRLDVAHRGTTTPVAAAPATLDPDPSSGEATVTPEASATPATAASTIAEWQARYREGKYADSLGLVRATGLHRRLDELSPGALAELADTARLGGDPELAVRALRALLRRFPGSPEARDGAFLLGRVHALRGDRAQATEAFERYLRGGASARYTNEALGRLMELYATRGDREKARDMARRYTERAPKGPYGRLARSLLE